MFDHGNHDHNSQHAAAAQLARPRPPKRKDFQAPHNGHSLGEADRHIIRRIVKGKLKQVFVGVYGDPTSDSNKMLMRKATSMATSRRENNPLSVKFFDAATAKAWG